MCFLLGDATVDSFCCVKLKLYFVLVFVEPVSHFTDPYQTVRKSEPATFSNDYWNQNLRLNFLYSRFWIRILYGDPDAGVLTATATPVFESGMRIRLEWTRIQIRPLNEQKDLYPTTMEKTGSGSDSRKTPGSATLSIWILLDVWLILSQGPWIIL